MVTYDVIERMTNVMLFGLEGNVGVGKSRAIDVLREASKNDLQVISEPLEDILPTLERFYSNPSYYAFPFQVSMLLRRARIHFYELRHSTKSFIVERTIYTDRNVFALAVKDSGFIDDIQFKEYLGMFDELSHFVKEPDVYVYLRGDVDFLLERIHRRGRKGEEKITRDYLLTLQDFYDRWLLENPRSHCVKIDRDLSNEELLEVISSATGLSFGKN